MYRVLRIYYETQEASDLGVFETLSDAKDRLVDAIEDAFDRERGLGCESVRKRTDLARRQGYYHYCDDDGTVSSLFTIQGED